RRQMQTTCYTYLETPIGRLLLAGDDLALRRISFPEGKQTTEPAPYCLPDAKPLRDVARQLQAYFTGELREFDVPLRMEGTPFQRSVWLALQNIPYGETLSY